MLGVEYIPGNLGNMMLADTLAPNVAISIQCY